MTKHAIALREANAFRVHAQPVMPAHNTTLIGRDLLALYDEKIANVIASMRKRNGKRAEHDRAMLMRLCEARNTVLMQCLIDEA